MERGVHGSELCLHNSQLLSWAQVPRDNLVIIDGYESRVDAAVNLAHAGKQCKVLVLSPCWNAMAANPSAELASYTASHIHVVLVPTSPPGRGCSRCFA